MTVDHTLGMLRGYVFSQVIHELIASGVLAQLATGCTLERLRSLLPGSERALQGLLVYLQAEQVIVRGATEVTLTETGRALLDQRGWFRLFVGGYQPVLNHLHAILIGAERGDHRDFHSVALGSGEIAMFDAGPLATRLLRRSERRCGSILDVGCGNGLLLQHLLAGLAEARGIGLDRSAAAIEDARKTFASNELEHRVEFLVADALEIDLGDRPPPDVILAAFLLQEILGQTGEGAVVSYLDTLSRRWPDAAWLVIEVDYTERQDVLGTHHGLGYYNPYFLFHALTPQLLVPRERWSQIFERAGLTIVDCGTTDPEIDATGLELGFLLRRKR